MSSKKKTIKKANGMGSVYKLKGNRRRPWVACVTTSIEQSESKYKQKRKIIGFYESQEAAEFSLWKYNRNPVLFEELQKLGALTFENIYDQWSKMKYKNLSQNAVNGYKAAYAKCEAIKHMKIADLKTMHFQQIMDESELSVASDLKLKSLMVSVCEYAMQNDIITKNYAKYVMINRKEETEDIHKPFTEGEIKKLFRHDEIPFVDTILIMIYTGFRVGDDDDKIRLNQRKPSKYKGLSRFGPEKNLQRINKFMKERPTFYKKLIQMKENFRFYLRCFYCITKVVILQFNSEKQDRISS